MTPNELGHKVQRAQRRLDELRADAEAGGGAVRLTLTADCRLVGLDLDPRAFDLGAERVAALVVEAHERAYAAARRAADSALAELTGDPIVARALDLTDGAEADGSGEAAGEGGEIPVTLLVDPLGRDV
jgi:DNA-binding protein YbaB